MLVAVVAVAAVAAADAPQVIAYGLVEPFEITVLAEIPIRPGNAQWVVWVEDARDLRAASGPRAGSPPATHVEVEIHGMRSDGVAPGPIPVHIHAPGRASAKVVVRRDGREADLVFEIEIEAASRLIDHWRALAIAPIGLLVFALHQWRARGAPTTRPRIRRRPAAG